MPEEADPADRGSDSDERDSFLEFVSEGLAASRSPRFSDLFGLWEAGFATDGVYLTVGTPAEPGFSDSHVMQALGWTGVSVERLSRPGEEPGTVSRLLDESDAPDQVDFVSVELAEDERGLGLAALQDLGAGRHRIRALSFHPADDQRDEVHRLLTGQGYRRKWPRVSGSRHWYVPKHSEPRSREPADLRALVRRLDALPPLDQDLAARRRLLSDLVDRVTTDPVAKGEIATSPAALAVADYPRPRHRAAVIQFEAGHEDGAVAMAHLLRLNGVEPTVYLNHRIQAMRPGFEDRFPELAGSTRFVGLDEARDWWRLLQRVRRSGVDLVVLNTFEHPGPANWAAEWDGPLIGVVHDPRWMLESDPCMALVRAGRIGLVTLAPHATAFLMEADPVLFGSTATITYAYPRPPVVEPALAPGRRFAVPGTVTFDSRDYGQLLDALPAVTAEVGDVPFDFCVTGGGRDRQALEDLVAERGLSDRVHFAEVNEHGFVSQGDYFSLLRGSTFLLPLSKGQKLSFRRRKITASIPAAISLGLPPVLDRWTATVYDVPAVTYTIGEIDDGLVRALTMTEGEIDELKQRLADRHDRDMARAVRELGYALGRVGLDARPGALSPHPEGGETGSALTDRFRRYVRRRGQG